MVDWFIPVGWKENVIFETAIEYFEYDIEITEACYPKLIIAGIGSYLIYLTNQMSSYQNSSRLFNTELIEQL